MYYFMVYVKCKIMGKYRATIIKMHLFEVLTVQVKLFEKILKALIFILFKVRRNGLFNKNH